MTTVYVLAALLVLAAAAFFAIPRLPNPVRVIPHRPEPRGGMLTWKVDFRLWFNARRDGFIVQHVRIRRRVTNCADAAFANAGDTQTEFWEAWPIQGGTVIPVDRLGPLPPVRDFDDAFVFRIPWGDLPFGRGRVRLEVRATVRFYAGVTLPTSFIANNPNTEAGAALSDVAPPPFWRPGGTRHELTAEWDNCAGEERWKVDEVPKFQE
jgi:hypothetical protein